MTDKKLEKIEKEAKELSILITVFTLVKIFIERFFFYSNVDNYLFTLILSIAILVLLILTCIGYVTGKKYSPYLSIIVSLLLLFSSSTLNIIIGIILLCDSIYLLIYRNKNKE